ncbi:unnamed protein product [Caenorhabditis auriculariae]|uniref:Uncharacterized protein n=1 Tax=Caenorhabditis auriculariae TaxID=2777116 RepID=A0A8S1HRW0_9PELO|nr:unnamed protein product [Caenorhabditis auriculariae]
MTYDTRSSRIAASLNEENLYTDIPSCSVILSREINYSSSLNRLKVQREIEDRRLYNLRLLRNQKYKFRAKAAVEVIAIDKQDNSFLLCGGINGCVDIMNLYTMERSVGFKPFNEELPRPLSFDQKHMIKCAQWCAKDNRFFVTSSSNKNLSLNDVEYLSIVSTNKCEFSPKSLHWKDDESRCQFIAVADGRPEVKLYDLKTFPNTIALHLCQKSKTKMTAVQWHPSGILIAGDAKGYVHLCDKRKARRPLHSFSANCAQIEQIRCTSDGLFFVTIDLSYRVIVWNSLSFKKLAQHEHVRRSDWSSQPKDLSLYEDGNVVWIAYPLGDEVKILVFNRKSALLESHEPLRGHLSRVNTCQFRNGHQQILSGGADQNLLWWAPNSDFEALTRRDEIVERVQAQEDNWSDED